MQTFTGKIRIADRLLFEGVAIEIDEIKGSLQSLGSWRGEFTLKVNPLPPHALLLAEGPYSLTLDDGRSGEFLVLDNRDTDYQTYCAHEIQGTGALR